MNGKEKREEKHDNNGFCNYGKYFRLGNNEKCLRDIGRI